MTIEEIIQELRNVSDNAGGLPWEKVFRTAFYAGWIAAKTKAESTPISISVSAMEFQEIEAKAIKNFQQSL